MFFFLLVCVLFCPFKIIKTIICKNIVLNMGGKMPHAINHVLHHVLHRTVGVFLFKFQINVLKVFCTSML